MNYKKFKKYSLWLSQLSAVISLVAVVFVHSKSVFENANAAGHLVLTSIIFALLTLIFGVVALPHWQGFVSLIVFAYVAYCILFTPLYAIA